MLSVIFWNNWNGFWLNKTFLIMWQIPTIQFDCLPAFWISPLRDKGRHLALTNVYENNQIVKIQFQIREWKWTLKMRKHL